MRALKNLLWAALGFALVLGGALLWFRADACKRTVEQTRIDIEAAEICRQIPGCNLSYQETRALLI
jgi:hypothetical protein